MTFFATLPAVMLSRPPPSRRRPRATLFKGVPLFYLAADERMLPAESIRFFHVDQSWLTALIDGALSIGRVTASDVYARP
jgi:hypothetical protein